ALTPALSPRRGRIVRRRLAEVDGHGSASLKGVGAGLQHDSVLHSELFALSRAGGDSRRTGQPGAARAGFRDPVRGRAACRRKVGFSPEADVRHHAERTWRPWLFARGTALGAPRAEGGGPPGRGP